MPLPLELFSMSLENNLYLKLLTKQNLLDEVFDDCVLLTDMHNINTFILVVGTILGNGETITLNNMHIL